MGRYALSLLPKAQKSSITLPSGEGCNRPSANSSSAAPSYWREHLALWLQRCRLRCLRRKLERLDPYGDPQLGGELSEDDRAGLLLIGIEPVERAAGCGRPGSLFGGPGSIRAALFVVALTLIAGLVGQ
jgi:hypothetical protein